MRIFASNIFLLSIVSMALISGCKEAQSLSNNPEIEYIKIGNLELMKDNLKSSLSDYDAFCYDNDPENCSSIGAIYNWSKGDSICPKGWHLPNTAELLELINSIPGSVNPNNGKLMSAKTAASLNIQFGGGKTKSGGLDRYYGKGSQEIWLVASDSIWTDPNNLDTSYYLTALHIYAKSKDSINIEPTFSDNPTQFYGYCRCIKDTTANLIANFETELNNLNKTSITSIDQATSLFQKYATKTTDINQRDALFMPYFEYYNLGRELLKQEPRSVQERYGFNKHVDGEKSNLLPTESEYLESNIIKYLSQPMQDFCNQNLKEFDDVNSLETIASNALWWEKFNDKNPEFLLKDMTNYHYKNWHLKNLISGTEKVILFTKEGKLSDEALNIYTALLKNNPESKTATIIKDYLRQLKKSNFEKTEIITEFIDAYK